MRKILLFLIVLIATLASLIILAFISWYYSVTSPDFYMNSWMNQIWGGSGISNGMGGMMGGGTSTSTSFLWIIPLILGISIAIAIIGVAFYLAFPELKYIRRNTTCDTATTKSTPQTRTIEKGSQSIPSENQTKGADNCAVLLKTMTDEEQKVLNVLIAHKGKYLQKYVVKESGLSRLKTHRIVARFAKRGIVSIKEFGNTNEIIVSDWVKNT
jgi:hypothetical protein